MSRDTADDLRAAGCVPCEGGVPKFSPDEAREQLDALDGWDLADDGTAIHKQWEVDDFAAALAFVNRIGEVAEEEQHHPDLHLTGYNRVTVELTTHAIDGLSRNDFILAAKIDAPGVAPA